MKKSITKEKILNTSIKLFTIRGYKKTTTKLIAREAGVNEVTLFRQFGSKERIVQEIIREKLPYLQTFIKYFQEEASFVLKKDLIKGSMLYYEGVSKNINMLMALSYEMGPAFQHAFSKFPVEVKDALTNYFLTMQQQKKIINVEAELLAVSFLSANIGFALINDIFSGHFIQHSYKTFIKHHIEVFIQGIKI